MRSLRSSPRVAIAATACAFAGLFPANALAQADLSIDLADSAIAGTTGADNLTGTRKAEVIAGLDGGSAGNDTLRGGSGIDRCRGGPGQDIRRRCE